MWLSNVILKLGFRRAFDGTVNGKTENSMCITKICHKLAFFFSWKSKKVCSSSSGCNAQSYLFNKCGVGPDALIYQYFRLFLVEPKVWTANEGNSYFWISRKIWFIFLIALFVNKKNYTILLFSGGLSKICCTKLNLLQDIRKFYEGGYSTCTCFWTRKGASKASLLIPWQRCSWYGANWETRLFISTLHQSHDTTTQQLRFYRKMLLPRNYT